jgi:hypothetical protein
MGVWHYNLKWGYYNPVWYSCKNSKPLCSKVNYKITTLQLFSAVLALSGFIIKKCQERPVRIFSESSIG